MATNTQRMRRVEKAQIRVIFTVPFFAPGLAKLPVIFDEAVKTACTDGTCIWWGPSFFDSLSDGQLVTVMAHETAHCLLGHAWRAPDGVDWRQWNEACDHAVNLMLKEFSAGVMGKGLADPLPFPEPADAYCADARFANMAEETIYKALGNRPKPQSGGGNGAGKASGASGGVPTPSGATKSQGGGNAAQSGGKPAPGSMPEFGQFSKPSGPNVQKLGSDWQSTMIQSAKLASGQGTLPGSLARMVGELLHPTVPWWELLRSWIREQATDDWTWEKPAMEFDGSDLILPSLNSERVGTVVFCVDTSGSIDDKLLSQFKGEMQNCLDEMRPRKLVEICCDTRITSEREFTTGDIIPGDAPGGGGTSFVPALARCVEMNPPPKCVVFLTDLCGTFPTQEPGIPLIWCVWGKHGKAPFGEVVRL